MSSEAPTIRSFRAPDARLALAAVKAALGSDAVVLGSRQIPGGLFGRPKVEITAVAGSPSPPSAAAAARTSSHAGTSSSASTSAAERPWTAAPAAASSPAPRRGGAGGGGGDVDVAALNRVMEDVRRTLHRGRPARERDAKEERGEYTADARRVFRQLLDRGIDVAQAQGWVDAAIDAGATRAADIERAVGGAASKALVPGAAPWGADARRTIALVGPTGVGKTTAIAKIAARALLETRFKVGLITVDTYRVGASDQLARYGKIMDAPTYVARDRRALAEAIDRTRDADLVLIDTAGRSDPTSMSAQIDLVRTAPQVQINLVLSVVAGGRDLDAIARRYKAFGVERLIFTKLDEAEAPGAALAAAAVLQRPIACVCDGQRVPEDIHAVTDASLLQSFLGFAAPRASRRASYAPMGSISVSESLEVGDSQEHPRGPGR